MMRKTVHFNKTGIERLPDDKPVVYKIQTKGGSNNYTGVAKTGRVQERIGEHLRSGKDPVPGAKVQIEQVPTIAEAKQRERAIIGRDQPPHNKNHK